VVKTTRHKNQKPRFHGASALKKPKTLARFLVAPCYT
jgi:hypothetical protein